VTELERLGAAVARDGFAFAARAVMSPLLGPLPDWEAFAASWNDLPRDGHLPDGHRYRRRRYSTLSARAGEGTFTLEAHQPHYQGRQYNQLVGGIERWFEPFRPEILASRSFASIMAFVLRFFGKLRPGIDWHIECHQFRIEARPEAVGLPTPEGVHRDGVDCVLVLMVNRVNIESGTTTVHGLDDAPLGSFTLVEPLDAAWVDDTRVKHGVTAVRPLDPRQPAYRDVLVVTLRNAARKPYNGPAAHPRTQ
jgi:hypothetical protein